MDAQPRIVLRRLRLAILLVAVIATALIVPTWALAGHQSTDVNDYTGCLNLNAGNIVGVAQGPAPKNPCANGQIQIHLSGGDITGVTTVGDPRHAGLRGNEVADGLVTIGLEESYRLPQGCNFGARPEWNGTLWGCAVDSDTTYSGQDFVISGQGCDVGTYVAGSDSLGKTICAPFPPTDAYVTYVSPSVPVQLSEGQNRFPKVAAIGVPDGRWLVQSEVVVRNATAFALQENSREVACALYDLSDGAPLPHEARVSREKIDGGVIGSDRTGVATISNFATFTVDDSNEGAIILGCGVQGEPGEEEFVTASDRRIVATPLDRIIVMHEQ